MIVMAHKTKFDIRGVNVDAETHCAHWHSPLDIVAIRMKCCGDWYACKECHEALAGHAIVVWQSDERDERAVLCGACGYTMRIAEYLESPDACPHCAAPFNPGCHHHHHFYFEM